MQSNVYERLNALEKIGIKFGLSNIRILLSSLGNPQNSYPSIMIAGTNGKGSVGAMLHQVLSEHNFRSGHYTSPHLVDVRERIRIGASIIPIDRFEEKLQRLFARIDALLAKSELENPPTYFETLTALAFLEFAESQVDFAVVEVGMGGRFDATNVLLPELSIITTIDYDHEEYLGRSLNEIAFEKAGIIKAGIPLVTGLVPGEAMQLFKKRCQEIGSSITSVAADDISRLRLENGYPVFEYAPWRQELRINLAGRFQAENASIALLACRTLSDRGVPLKKEIVQRAMNEVEWAGRLQRIDDNPPTLIDCAHNPMGAEALSRFLQDLGWSRNIFLFTAMKDKKIEPMLQSISAQTGGMVLTHIEPYARCAPMDQLQAAANKAGIVFETDDQIESAFSRAQNLARRSNLPLVIFGSIYLIGEILKLTGVRTSTA